MQITDTLTIENKTLNFTIAEDGECVFFKEFGIDVDYLIIVKSLDTDLTTNILHVKMSSEHNIWKYGWPINVTEAGDDHPGIRFDIHNVNGDLILKKTYRFNTTQFNIKLKSNPYDVTYHPFITFLYNNKFKSLCNLNENDVVYDLGANIGAFSLFCSNQDVRKIYSFEPNKNIFDYLKYNCEKYCNNVTLFKKAISNDFKRVSFGNNEGTLDVGSVACSIVDNGGMDVVSAINLETFAYINDLELPTFLKVDIEGSEYNFFESITNDFIKNCHTIFLEFHNRDERLNKIIDRLTKLNYKMSFYEDSDYVLKQSMGTIFFIKQL